MLPATLLERIDREVASEAESLHASEALGMQKVIDDELAEVWAECRVPDWDGYNALPVSAGAYLQAKRLLLSLPLGTRSPSIGATPDGHVTLEWHHGRRRSLTVTAAPDGYLHYAALLGPDRHCGTEAFFEDVPQTIRSLISQVYAC